MGRKPASTCCSRRWPLLLHRWGCVPALTSLLPACRAGQHCQSCQLWLLERLYASADALHAQCLTVKHCRSRPRGMCRCGRAVWSMRGCSCVCADACASWRLPSTRHSLPAGSMPCCMPLFRWPPRRPGRFDMPELNMMAVTGTGGMACMTFGSPVVCSGKAVRPPTMTPLFAPTGFFAPAVAVFSSGC